jgi:hypothetical protein
MTVDEAKQLRYREALINTETKKRWYVNGAVKVWITRPEQVRVPIKHGLWTYGYLTESNAFLFVKEFDHGTD